MRQFSPWIAVFCLIALGLCLSGCRNTLGWKKKDQKPQQNSVMMNDADVFAFNDFRTIDASLVESSGSPKQKKSLFWENNKARDIERRLGVK